MGVLADLGAGPQPRERPDDGAAPRLPPLPDANGCGCARRLAPSRRAPNTTKGSISTSASSTVSWDKNTVSGAVSVTPAAIAAWRSRVCILLSASASSARLLTPITETSSAIGQGAFDAFGLGEGGHIGEIIFLLGIVVLQRRRPAEEILRIGGIAAAIAQGDAALGFAGVLEFDNAVQKSVRRHQHPAILGRIGEVAGQQRQAGARLRLRALDRSPRPSPSACRH